MWQQIGEGIDGSSAGRSAADDRHRRVEFGEHLAAGAAGRHRRFRVRANRDRIESGFALGHSPENGRALSAHRETVGGVFHVASGEQAAVGRQNRSADAELRIGRISKSGGPLQRPAPVERSFLREGSSSRIFRTEGRTRRPDRASLRRSEAPQTALPSPRPRPAFRRPAFPSPGPRLR
jgi:hypothetical protein